MLLDLLVLLYGGQHVHSDIVVNGYEGTVPGMQGICVAVDVACCRANLKR